MNTRFEQFLAAENISQSQFADTIKVARASVSHILAGRNKPGWDFLYSMSKHYPNLNIEWLLNGTGKMYKSMNVPAPEPVRQEETLPPDLFSQPEPPAAEVKPISSQRNMTKDPETLHRHLVCRFRIELEQNRTDKMFVHVVYLNFAQRYNDFTLFQ